MKHVGRVENTGKRCIVVFREVYDEKGNVVEPDKCLVIESDSLPDFAHQDIMAILESEPAQRDGDFYNVLARTRLSNGEISLQWLHSQGRLRKYDTSNITLLPNSNSQISLKTLNRIIDLQKAGYDQSDIERIVKNNETVSMDRTQSEPTVPEPLSDEDLAKTFISQAEAMVQESEKLYEKAYAMAPQLKPIKRKRTTKSKSTDVKSTESNTENI